MLKAILDNSAILPAMLPLLAQVNAPDSGPAVGNWLLTLACILGILLVVLNIWRMLFPVENPPSNERYATKQQLEKQQLAHDAELERLEKELDASVDRVEKRFEQWLNQTAQAQEKQNQLMHDWQNGIERTLGRIESALPKRR
jgi:uncharacterized protein HemX